MPRETKATLREDNVILTWQRDQAWEREGLLADQVLSLRRQTAILEADNASGDAVIQHYMRRLAETQEQVVAAELRAAKAEADKAAAVLIVAEAQQDADTAVELAQKALAALVAKDAELAEVQRALEAAVGSGVDREFRP